jgi:ubiquinone/menaquinone biosynthesis C-methylase UbiE
LEYDRLAPVYDRRWQGYVADTLRGVLEVVHCRGDERVLDVACGTGELGRRLLARWPALRLVGVDLSLEMLRQAAGKADTARWVQADVGRLPFADWSFDWAVCSSSFHYFPSPLAALREVRRTLAPDGRLVLLDWCDDYLSCKLCSLWLRLTDPAFARVYSVRACRSLLEQAGFQILQVDRFRAGWVWGMMRFVCRPAAPAGPTTA